MVGDWRGGGSWGGQAVGAGMTSGTAGGAARGAAGRARLLLHPEQHQAELAHMWRTKQFRTTDPLV